MKREEEWLHWNGIELDCDLDNMLEPDDNWRNRYDEVVRFPSDLLGGEYK